MTFWLEVDAARWRSNTEAVRDELHGVGELVPVAKGNGYGLGLTRLAREATRLEAATVAVGTVHEVDQVATTYAGDVLVMTPYEPADTLAAAAWDAALAAHGERLVRTVGSAPALRTVLATTSAARPARVVLEGLTSTGRFGVTADALRHALVAPDVRDALDSGALVLEGLALHLPLSQPDPAHGAVPGAGWHDVAVEPVPPVGATGRVREALAWARGWSALLGDVQAEGAAGADVPQSRLSALGRAPTLWLSHLAVDELAAVADAMPGVPLRLRVGTRLWLGDRGALQAYGCVLAVHAQRRGDRAGYRQRRAGRDGALLVVGGGTSHGVALEAPSPVASVRQRVVAAGSGALEAGGRALSPFRIAGRQRWFAEPPHMQVSLLRLPGGNALPAVGDRVPCDVRLTTATFDRVLGLD